MCVFVLCILLEKTKIRPKNLHGVSSSFVVVSVCMCVFGSSIWKGQWYAFLCAVSLCVFYANKLSLSIKKIVRFNTTHVHFCWFFLAFCFIVHTGLFSLCRILLAKSYASPSVFVPITPSVASVLVWWWWWWRWLCIWYAFFNLFLTHMRSMSVCFLCVFARSFWWSLYICTDKEKQTNIKKKEFAFFYCIKWNPIDSCSQMWLISNRGMCLSAMTPSDSFLIRIQNRKEREMIGNVFIGDRFCFLFFWVIQLECMRKKTEYLDQIALQKIILRFINSNLSSITHWYIYRLGS